MTMGIVVLSRWLGTGLCMGIVEKLQVDQRKGA